MLPLLRLNYARLEVAHARILYVYCRLPGGFGGFVTASAGKEEYGERAACMQNLPASSDVRGARSLAHSWKARPLTASVFPTGQKSVIALMFAR